MVYEQMVIDRQAVEKELNRVFDPATTQIVVGVLNRVAISAVDATRPDLRAMQETLHESVQAQARTEARLDRIEAVLEELAQAQTRTEVALKELAQAQTRTEARLDRIEARLDRIETVLEKLAQAQARTEAALETLVHRVDKMDIVVGDLKGWALEDRYRTRPWAYLGRLLRRLRVVPWTDLEDDLAARLTRQEFNDLLRIDLLLRGRLARRPDEEPVWLAVEVSSVVDEHDIERARRRAATLRRAGYRAAPLAAGERVTPEARDLAAMQHIPLALDGQIHFWDEALADLLAE